MPPHVMETLQLPGISSLPEKQATCPRVGVVPRFPLADFDCDVPSFAGDTEG